MSGQSLASVTQGQYSLDKQESLPVPQTVYHVG